MSPVPLPTPSFESFVFNAPMPDTVEEMNARLRLLGEAKHRVESEIKDILNTRLYRHHHTHREFVTCVRCGHVWEPRSPLLRPVCCPLCRRRNWDRLPKYRMVRIQPGEDHIPASPAPSAPPPVVPPPPPFAPGTHFENVTLTPPPTVPALPLRERLRLMRQQEEQEPQPERQIHVVEGSPSTDAAFAELEHRPQEEEEHVDAAQSDTVAQ